MAPPSNVSNLDVSNFSPHLVTYVNINVFIREIVRLSMLSVAAHLEDLFGLSDAIYA